VEVRETRICTTFSSPEPDGARRVRSPQIKESIMKGIVAWLLGVPVVVIVLLYVFNIF
jgi:hypothetical protein